MNNLKQAAAHIISLIEWLDNCPFTTDGVYDCAAAELTSAEHQAVIIAEQMADKSFTESVQAAVYHSEYGTGPDGEENDQLSFWRHVSAIAEDAK